MPINEIDLYHFDGSFKIGVKGITLNFFVEHFNKIYVEYCIIDNRFPDSYFKLQLQTSKRVRAVVECYKEGKVLFFKEYKSWTKKEFKQLDKESVINEFYSWFVLNYGNMLPKPIKVKEYRKPVKFVYPKKKELS